VRWRLSWNCEAPEKSRYRQVRLLKANIDVREADHASSAHPTSLFRDVAFHAPPIRPEPHSHPATPPRSPMRLKSRTLPPHPSTRVGSSTTSNPPPHPPVPMQHYVPSGGITLQRWRHNQHRVGPPGSKLLICMVRRLTARKKLMDEDVRLRRNAFEMRIMCGGPGRSPTCDLCVTLRRFQERIARTYRL
jgi:hypothetical protein